VTQVLAVLLLAAIIGGCCYAGVRLFPWKTCPACNGDRRIYGAGGHKDCGRCGATGRVRRWGAPREDRR
jgi:hypothetical protein